jgi:hypothetical protein
MSLLIKMSDYEHTWYNNSDWEFKYIITVAKKPRFEEIDDLSKPFDDVKEIKGEYEVIQEKNILIYENAVFVHKEDSRTRFVLRDDLMNYNVDLNNEYQTVQPEDVEKNKIRINGKYYPYAEDIIPELEHREFKNSLDKLKAFFRETPVKEIRSEQKFLDMLPVKTDYVLRRV